MPLSSRSGKEENVYTHVIVTGRGISGTELIKSNSLLPNCDVPVYDLELQKGNKNILNSVIIEISDILDQIRPDVLIYINDHENEAMRGVDAALVAASQKNDTITKIAIPIEHAKHMKWLSDLSIEALKSWNTPNIQIQVITQDRPQSLSRLMKSLNSSIYFGDNQGGLITAVVESYYPTTNDDYAIILEDDIEVSPFYYIWAKYTILKYKYGIDRNLVGRLYGVSLCNTRLNEFNITTGRRLFNAAEVLQDTKYPNNSPYLSQIPCSWGVLFFPEIWREFHEYLNARKQDLAGPKLLKMYVPKSRSNRWGGDSWKRYFIELIYFRGYLMLYPNYEDFNSFTSNHAEKGVHFGSKNKHKVFWLLPLMEEDIILEGLPDDHLPGFKDLPIMDLESDELTFDPQDLLCVDNSTLSNE
ncbi:hypothetical protein C2G38_2158142 [Gigaspora rosea]|uniref:Uncharacterized protein n=1 Tax=Gigaspora rosea TaxID=44941 RepID=A0A397W2V6_9GLOM|nr:hypothetical protein C2G38_2158142 [Gigaspora rosea]